MLKGGYDAYKKSKKRKHRNKGRGIKTRRLTRRVRRNKRQSR